MTMFASNCPKVDQTGIMNRCMRTKLLISWDYSVEYQSSSQHQHSSSFQLLIVLMLSKLMFSMLVSHCAL